MIMEMEMLIGQLGKIVEDKLYHCQIDESFLSSSVYIRKDAILWGACQDFPQLKK